MNTRVKYLVMVIAMAVMLGACASVKTGQVGVKTSMSGKVSQCGVNAGMHWTGLGDMHTFTNRLQYSYMVADPKEGDRKEPDDVKVSSKESAGMSVDLQIGYTLQGDANTICRVYKTLAQDDAGVRDNILRPTVRSVAPDIFAGYTAKDAKTSKRGEIADKIRDSLNDRFKHEPFNGFVLVQSVQIGDVRLPADIQKLVDDAIKAEADAVTAELQRKADLTRAETERQSADLHRQTREIDSTAEADANRRLAASLTPDLANLKAVEACANALAQTKAQVATCGGNSSGSNILVSPGPTK